jgi:hypothetical protein
VSALEIISQAAAALGTGAAGQGNQLSPPVATATTTVYPNPSKDGLFKVMTDRQFQAGASFTLLSSSGTILQRGKLPPHTPGSAIPFDFSREMRSAGVYHLHLVDKDQHTVLKLIRD